MTTDDRPIAEIDVEDAARRLQADAGTAILVDVREADEVATVHVPGAVHAPMSDFVDAARSIPAGRSLFLICASGRRSLVAAEYLRRNGHADVANVTGGIIEWQKRGLPTAAGQPGGKASS